VGKVFGDRYKCVVVEGELPELLWELGRLHPPQPGEGWYCEREAGREPAGLSVEQPG
jgi:hypothetical protein